MLNSNQNVLRNVVGYVEAEEIKAQMEATGKDYSDEKGRVRATINQLHPKRLTLIVSEIIEDTPSTRTLRLISEEGYLPPFQAGQYINVFVNIDGVSSARPYAISSSPSQRQFYDLTIKRAEGGFVSHFLLDSVNVGDAFETSGPMGTFHYNPLFHGDDLVFFAGGSGIAPARSIARDIIDRQLPVKLHIIYSNSFEHDVIFAQEMRDLTESSPGITLTEIVSRPTEAHRGHAGRLTQEMLTQWIDQPDTKRYFICGPTPFNNHVASLLHAMGVKPGKIQVEANGPPKQPHQLADWPDAVAPDQMVKITVAGKGSFEAPANEPLLNSLERNGYGAENACRSGECSLCRIKLVSGTVFNPPESRLRKSDRQFGWIHSCVAFPTSDITIEI